MVKKSKPVRTIPRLTRHIVQPGDPVWVRIGEGECAGQIISVDKRNDRATVKFVTGAREVCECSVMRFREVTADEDRK
jgi:hypothetical protein